MSPSPPPLPPPSDPILTVDEAAAHARVSRATILDWIDHRGLRATPIGRPGRRGPRNYILFRSWVDACVQSNAEYTPPAAGSVESAPPAPPRPARKAPMRASDGPEGPLGPRPRAKGVGG